MTDNNTNASKAPTHIAHRVRSEGEKDYWGRIGAAWPHADGKGFNIQMDSIPLNGRIILRLAPEKRN